VPELVWAAAPSGEISVDAAAEAEPAFFTRRRAARPPRRMALMAAMELSNDDTG